jgi:hypothetical protein
VAPRFLYRPRRFGKDSFTYESNDLLVV